MLTLELTDGTPHVAERHRAEPVVLAGFPFVALGLLPLVTSGPITGLRLLTAVVLAGVAALCYSLGRPRTRTRPLSTGPFTELALSSAESLDPYRAELVHEDGSRVLVLARSEPAGVLRDALRLSTLLGVPLVPGWGLDDAALSLLREPKGTSAPPEIRLSESHGPILDQRIGAMTALWAAIFIPSASAVLVLSPARPEVPPSALALILPAVTALIALAIGMFLVGLRQHLVVADGRLETHRAWFGVRLRSQTHSIEPVLGVFAVAPDGYAAEHILVATPAGPVAIPTDRLAGRLFQRRPAVGDQSAGRAAE